MKRIQAISHDAPSYIDFPFRIDWTGRAAVTSRADHVRDLIEQVLFTSPGERVNRPGFGSGIERLIFSPNNTLLAETIRITAEASVQQWLGDLIELVALNIETHDSTVTVEVVYQLRSEQEPQTARFERSR
jgi:uncharacterized protein